jgi:hypothetical protein
VLLPEASSLNRRCPTKEGAEQEPDARGALLGRLAKHHPFTRSPSATHLKLACRSSEAAQHAVRVRAARNAAVSVAGCVTKKERRAEA